MTAKVTVLVVDDSAFFRRRITSILSSSDDIEVLGQASNGRQAVEEAKRLRPDVITMDVEMPVMNGIEAARQISREIPTRILMFSSLTHEGAQATLDALEAGAVDFLPKQLDPRAGDANARYEQLRRKVIDIGRRASARVARRIGAPREPLARPGTTPAGRPLSSPAAAPAAAPVAPKATPRVRKGQYKLLLIGASTGGPMAIQQILKELPANFPLPIMLVVHMPGSFTPAYAERLNTLCQIQVKEAKDNDSLQPGVALLAPGGMQLLLDERAGRHIVHVRESLPDQTYRPSVDASFGSAARVLNDKVLAVVLTGMGADGKQGAQLLKRNGSNVWSQDAESCVVYGMPQAVEKAGLSDLVLPLNEIGGALIKAV